MTQRPLMQTGIELLERLFRGSKDNATELAKLEAELSHRSTQRAVSLLRLVRLAQRQLAQSGQGDSKVRTTSEPDLFDTAAPPPPKLPHEDIEDPAFSKRMKPPTPLAPVAPPIPEAMTVDEAYRVLKVTASSTWEAIEQARRELVQRASPENIERVSHEKRAALLAETKKANAAYRVLAQVRI